LIDVDCGKEQVFLCGSPSQRLSVKAFNGESQEKERRKRKSWGKDKNLIQRHFAAMKIYENL